MKDKYKSDERLRIELKTVRDRQKEIVKELNRRHDELDYEIEQELRR